MDMEDNVQPRSRFSISNLLKVIVGIVLVGVLVKFCTTDRKDPYKCGAVLRGGQWLDPPKGGAHGLSSWQPPGCMMHNYRSKEIYNCLTQQRLVFIGDSSIRNVFWGLARKLDPRSAAKIHGEKHANIHFQAKGVQLEFIWDPYINGSQLAHELANFSQRFHPFSATRVPALLVIGGGLWYARFVQDNPMKQWKDNIDRIIGHMFSDKRSLDMTDMDLLLLAPVAVPAWELLSYERSVSIDRNAITAMNGYLNQLALLQGYEVLQSWNELTREYPQQAFDATGLHVTHAIAERQADVVLNLRCNNGLTQYPHDNTCCNRYSRPDPTQWIILVIVMIILPVWLVWRKESDSVFSTKSYEVSASTIQAGMIFGLIVVLCFYCDRTQIFEKRQKQWSPLEYGIMSIITVLIGLSTISTASRDEPFLNRDQTDEWKGWMQFAILIYHYTGASKITPIYTFIRILVASYLFMTGFGHTVFFYRKGNYSFKRVAAVLVRLNLLSCILPYMMKTDYLFYYFAPLVTFWFGVVYFTMRIGCSRNKSTAFLLSKILLSAILVTAVTKIPFFFDRIGSTLQFLFRTQWNMNEWRFRVLLDMWVVYFGMLVAIVFSKYTDGVIPLPAHRQRLIIIASAILLPAFLLYAFFLPSKFVYNVKHPYISFIPIGAFIVLRNATSKLRRTHSRAFAWLGRCSLETFTLQFHMWMAADTKGLLELGLFDRTYTGYLWNFALTTTIFLYLSWCMAAVTSELTSWILKTPSPTQGTPNTNGSYKSNKVLEEGKSGLVTPGNGHLSNTGSHQSSNTIYVKLWGDLRTRLGIILMGMWFLNLVSSFF